uniref:Uncharacterized protein n=1 Tax=Oryza sativa subsp. japonica TaxID=39947 RepID=Q67UW4_ORYSJ|nr:hypothetical protein [Oryza sativa Japonica Group]
MSTWIISSSTIDRRSDDAPSPGSPVDQQGWTYQKTDHRSKLAIGSGGQSNQNKTQLRKGT